MTWHSILLNIYDTKANIHIDNNSNNDKALQLRGHKKTMILTQEICWKIPASLCDRHLSTRYLNLISDLPWEKTIIFQECQQMPSMVEYIPGVAMVEYILGVANLNTNIQSKISKKITWFNLNLVYRGSLFLNAGISRCSCAVSGKTSRYWPGINVNLLEDKYSVCFV